MGIAISHQEWAYCCAYLAVRPMTLSIHSFFFFDKVLGMGFILWTMPWIHDFHAIIAPVSMPCQDSHYYSFHNSQLGKTENFWPPVACKTPSSTIKASQCRRSFEVRISLFSLYSMTQVSGVFNNMALPSCSVR